MSCLADRGLSGYPLSQAAIRKGKSSSIPSLATNKNNRSLLCQECADPPNTDESEIADRCRWTHTSARFAWERLRDLFCDLRTTESWVAPLHLNNRRNDFLGRPLGPARARYLTARLKSPTTQDHRPLFGLSTLVAAVVHRLRYILLEIARVGEVIRDLLALGVAFKLPRSV